MIDLLTFISIVVQFVGIIRKIVPIMAKGRGPALAPNA
jgi:hypothetical protein